VWAAGGCLDLTARLMTCFTDTRDPARFTHALTNVLARAAVLALLRITTDSRHGDRSSRIYVCAASVRRSTPRLTMAALK
jgi:hypothetical protein